ncbi:MAG: hypothetical protein AAFZ07_29255 [Actinomycetota bacterium]
MSALDGFFEPEGTVPCFYCEDEPEPGWIDDGAVERECPICLGDGVLAEHGGLAHDQWRGLNPLHPLRERASQHNGWHPGQWPW